MSNGATLLHRSLSRWDTSLLLGCNRRALIDTWFYGASTCLVLLYFGVSIVAVIGIIVLIVRRTMVLRDLGKMPYGYEIHMALVNNSPILPRGGRPFGPPFSEIQ